MWRATQTHALFTNETGRIRIAEMMMPLPVDEPELLGGRYLTRQNFDAMRARAPARWDAEQMRQWVQDYAGFEVTGFESVAAHHAIHIPCREFLLAARDGAVRAFLLRMQDARGGRFLLFLFEFPDAARWENLEAAIYRMLRSVTSAALAPGVEKTADLRRTRPVAVGTAREVTPEFAAARQRVIDQIRALDSWWYVEMHPYLLVSNLPRSRRTLVDRIQRDVEILRPAFMTLFPPWAEMREVSVIKVFDQRSAYVDYVGAENEWTLGVWMPSRNELVIAPGGPQGRSHGTPDILRTTYHEAFHQYVHHALDELEIPVWMNEGHAMLFEDISLKAARGSVVINENSSLVHVLEQARTVGQWPDLVRLMYMDRDRFYGPGHGSDEPSWERSFHYASAWALVYYLRKGAPVVHGDRGYERIIPGILEHLRGHPGDLDGAHDAVLERLDRGRLQRDFDAFWNGRAERAAARRHRLL